MFQYTHELVLNKLNTEITKRLEDNGVKTNKITIERGGEYYVPFIQGGVIWKTEAVEGKLDKITLDVSKLNITNGKNYALNMFVKLVDPHALFEYGYPNYNTFGKQVLIDFLCVGDAEKDAQTILESILPVVMENDLTFVKGDVDGTKVILEVGHTGLRFDSLAIAEYDPTTCDSCIGEYMAPIAILDRSDWKDGEKANSNSFLGEAIEHTVVGVDPFATGEWLIENLRFPSYPNIRWAAIGEENRPIPGEKYTMYSFAYESPRVGLGGLSGVGQKLEAVTRHIYYVRESLVDDFEKPFKEFSYLTIKEVNASEKLPAATKTKSETARTEMSVNEYATGKEIPATMGAPSSSSEEPAPAV